jgi:hypothetical protein
MKSALTHGTTVPKPRHCRLHSNPGSRRSRAQCPASIEEGQTVVRAMNPGSVMELLAHPDLEEVGRSGGAALQRVVASCSA